MSQLPDTEVTISVTKHYHNVIAWQRSGDYIAPIAHIHSTLIMSEQALEVNEPKFGEYNLHFLLSFINFTRQCYF